MVTFLRMRRISASLQPVISSWATITCPLSGLRKPMMCPRVTDFPTPLRPMMATVSPAFTQKEQLMRTGRSKLLQTSRNSM